MPSTPSIPRTTTINSNLGLVHTPINSPYTRTPRSPRKLRTLQDVHLSLSRLIGNTVESPSAFDGLSSHRSFAYCAGAIAVIVTVNEHMECSQRFFRAWSAQPYQGTQQLQQLGGSTKVVNEFRVRTVTSIRESGVGNSPSSSGIQSEWSDSPNRTMSGRERVKATACLSLSRDGRFLAVGETGHAPRILIFNTEQSTDHPLIVINEHSYGVRAVAFSPDGSYLASLGTINDGFLHLWSLHTRTASATLHSSNKCTSLIKGLAWMGSSLVTVGTRHVKIWRPQDVSCDSSSKSKINAELVSATITSDLGLVSTLGGRNCLLGPLADCTFSCIATLSASKAVICTEQGDVCLLDDIEGQKLFRLCHLDFAIKSVAMDSKGSRICVGGLAGNDVLFNLGDFLGDLPAQDHDMPRELVPTQQSSPCCAMTCIDGMLVSVDDTHTLSLRRQAESQDIMQTLPLTAHHDAVLGIRRLEEGQASVFLTWSRSHVLFWDNKGQINHSINVGLQKVLGEDGLVNQCQVVKPMSGTNSLIIGDRLGMLYVVNVPSGECVFQAKSHNSEITDVDAITINDTLSLIATCGRDRTIQLYRKTRATAWALQQTLDDHGASVSCLCFSKELQQLISCSTDRTIQIRQLVTREVGDEIEVAALTLRTINLKSSPISLTLYRLESSMLIMVSLMDRTIAVYDANGRLESAFKASDLEGTESVVMDSLIVGKVGQDKQISIVAGVSSTDKSVRIYDLETGLLLAREWGHTAAVTGLTLMPSGASGNTEVISTASDGTIMFWSLSQYSNLSPETSSHADQDKESPVKDQPSIQPPLRRVLSKSDLAMFTMPTSGTALRCMSPPRTMRRKPSKHSMSTNSYSPALPALPALPADNSRSVSESEGGSKRASPRARSKSPSQSPRRIIKRPSLAVLSSRGRTKSAGNTSEFGSLNMATEQVCRTLRAYRKKLSTTEELSSDALRDLDHELRATSKALGEKTLKSKAMDETLLVDLLDQYSDKLVSMFDEKLRMSLLSDSVCEQGVPSTTSRPHARQSSVG